MLIANTSLRRLTIYTSFNDAEMATVIEALAFNTSLRTVALLGSGLNDDTVRAVTSLARRTTTLQRVDVYNNVQEYFGSDPVVKAALMRALDDNVYSTFIVGAFRSSSEFDKFSIRNSMLQWSNVHYRLRDLCIALAPLRLPSYVILWVFDWLPSHYMIDNDEWRSLMYRAHGLRKLRLIDAVMQSYVAVLARRELNDANK